MTSDDTVADWLAITVLFLFCSAIYIGADAIRSMI